jgi:hypothetical protein
MVRSSASSELLATGDLSSAFLGGSPASATPEKII